MVLPNLNFWSYSFEERIESQQNYALENRSLRALLCSNNNFNPRYSRKMFIRKRASIRDGVCFTYAQLFYQVKCTVLKISQGNSKYKFFPESDWFFCQLQINLIIFELQLASVVVHDKIQVVCIRLEIHTCFSSAIEFTPFSAGNFSFGISFFNVWHFCISTSVSVIFLGKAFKVVTTT